MLESTELSSLAQQVLWVAFALGVAFGAIAQRTHFCTLGALADLVNIGDSARLRMWVLAMGVAVLGFNGMVALGWVAAADSLYAAPRLMWLSAIVGGVMFGVGMVLASGCGSKTLIRIGGGNLKSLVVFVVLGVSAFATLKGITAVLRAETVDQVALVLPTNQDLPSLLAHAGFGSTRQLALLVGGVIGFALVGFALARPEGRRGDVLLGGVGVGALVVAAWWVSGRLGYLAEDPNTLQEAFVATSSQRMESLSFVAPMAYTLDWLMFFSDRSKHLTFGIASAAGIVLGSAAMALVTRSFRWEGFRSVTDMASHLIGAVLMGVGGVTALGCTIGQGVAGLSTLSLGSFIALAAMVLGAVLTLRWQAAHV